MAGLADAVRQAFAAADVSHDGRLNAEELGGFLKSLGGTYTDAEVGAMFALLDTDASGTVSLAEFVEWVLAVNLPRDELKAAIRAGTECVVLHSTGLWESKDSWFRIGSLSAGQKLIARGPPEWVLGYDMVPVEPRGAVEMSDLYLSPSATTSNAGHALVVELPEGLAAQHRTDVFASAAAATDAHARFGNAPVVLRRGAVVRVQVSAAAGEKLDRALLRGNAIMLEDRWEDSAPPITILAARSLDEVANGRCFTKVISESEVELSFGLPKAMPAGEYSLQVAPGGNLAKSSLNVPRVLVLFNPWSPLAEEHLQGEDACEEYVMLDSGLLFRGNFVWPSSTGWVYGQFEPGVLAASCKMLRGLRALARSSPAAVARAASAACCHQDGHGVLVGNWSGNYEGGQPPTAWNSSVDILSAWARDDRPVKFGQCWVFAGILTSMLRCLGIASRPVTNFESAHDANNTRMIEKVYDEHGNKLDENGDSIWNYHVWVEAWMQRPDLSHTADVEFGGWQVVDATPQELSGGRYQCGPSSVAAVKLGLSLPFDTDFVIGEVNADVRRYTRTNGELKLIAVNKTHVGRKILTKRLGSWAEDGEDILDAYKHPEGSLLERASLLRLEHEAEAKLVPRGELALELPKQGHVRLGEKVSAALRLLPQAGFSYAPEVRLSLQAFAIDYTGRGRNQLGSREEVLSLADAEGKGIELELDTRDRSFESVLRDSGFSLVVVGVAAWADQAEGALKDSLVTLLDERGVELIAPEVEMVSLDPAPRIGEVSVAKLRFRNPFKDRELTGIEVYVDGAGLTSSLRLQFPSLEPGGTLIFEIEVTPRSARDSHRLLVVSVESDQIQDIHGKFDIVV